VLGVEDYFYTTPFWLILPVVTQLLSSLSHAYRVHCLRELWMAHLEGWKCSFTQTSTFKWATFGKQIWRRGNIFHIVHTTISNLHCAKFFIAVHMDVNWFLGVLCTWFVPISAAHVVDLDGSNCLDNRIDEEQGSMISFSGHGLVLSQRLNWIKQSISECHCWTSLQNAKCELRARTGIWSLKHSCLDDKTNRWEVCHGVTSSYPCHSNQFGDLRRGIPVLENAWSNIIPESTSNRIWVP